MEWSERRARKLSKISLKRLSASSIVKTGESAPLGVRRRARYSCHHLKDPRMREIINRFRRDEEGAALVEYGMLVGLIAVICVAAVTLLGTDISAAFSTIASSLATL
jgi:pilus assembly protein Flp/PilA